MKGLTRVIAIVLIIVFIFTGCNQPAKEEVQDKVLKVGVFLIDDSLPLFVAEAENLFAQNNVQVELLPFNSARDKDVALETGEIDGVLTDIVVTALLKKGGTDVKITSFAFGANPQEGRFAILASPKSGINSPEDLKGVPIAISNNTMIHYLAEKMPLEAGLKKEDIKTQSIPDMNVRLEALVSSGVEAAILPDPLATLAEKMGARVVIDDTKLSKNLSQSVIIFRQEVLDKHRDKVASFLKAFEEAGQLINNNPDKYFELRMEKTRVPQPLRDSYPSPTYSPLAVPDEEMVQSVLDWMVEKGLLDQPFSYEELVDNSFVKR
ncbi:MAG: ABC transporter substrate-binding protein [Clostridia bacterium]|nr:ABC transporter substrate-binding protein [Clostridia bacterium]